MVLLSVDYNDVVIKSISVRHFMKSEFLAMPIVADAHLKISREEWADGYEQWADGFDPTQ